MKEGAMINGAHVIINSTNSDADRGFLKEVLGLPSVDVGQGWLIFGLPPSEVAVHPAEAASHDLYLMCEDVGAFIAEMRRRNIACADAQDQGWGILSEITLPGGGKLGVYQPRHARPPVAGVKGAKAAKPAKRIVKKAGKRAVKKAKKKGVRR